MVFRTGLCLAVSVVQEALVIAHEHLGFNLLQRFQDYTHDNDNGCSSKRDVCSKHAAEKDRDDTYNDQSHCTDKYNII